MQQGQNSQRWKMRQSITHTRNVLGAQGVAERREDG